jgi:hypothetical protein
MNTFSKAIMIDIYHRPSTAVQIKPPIESPSATRTSVLEGRPLPSGIHRRTGYSHPFHLPGLAIPTVDLLVLLLRSIRQLRRFHCFQCDQSPDDHPTLQPPGSQCHDQCYWYTFCLNLNTNSSLIKMKLQWTRAQMPRSPNSTNVGSKSSALPSSNLRRSMAKEVSPKLTSVVPPWPLRSRTPPLAERPTRPPRPRASRYRPQGTRAPPIALSPFTDTPRHPRRTRRADPKSFSGASSRKRSPQEDHRLLHP